MQVRCRLHVHGDARGPGVDKGIHLPLRLDHHQVDVEGKAGHAAQALHHQRTHGDGRHEATVHDVDVDEVGAAPLRGGHLVAQASEVCGQDADGDLDGAAQGRISWTRVLSMYT